MNLLAPPILPPMPSLGSKNNAIIAEMQVPYQFTNITQEDPNSPFWRTASDAKEKMALQLASSYIYHGRLYESAKTQAGGSSFWRTGAHEESLFSDGNFSNQSWRVTTITKLKNSGLSSDVIRKCITHHHSNKSLEAYLYNIIVWGSNTK